MKILLSLPTDHPEIPYIDAIIEGKIPSSGTTGSIIRVANLLADSEHFITLSSASPSFSNFFPCIQHQDVKPDEFDRLIVHQSHWNGTNLTFGNEVLSKTSLWFHNATTWSFINNFWQKGGNKVIFPSLDFANSYRAIPGWSEKVVVLYNSYCPIFQPKNNIPQKRLLFIGAITPTKGFKEVMQLWSYLIEQKVDLSLAIAGSIAIHKSSNVATGSMGIAESEFEVKEIHPWLSSLPERYQPKFLGSLPPVELSEEISKSLAVLVNPSWEASETFCVGAVDAQSCDCTVFSIALGGLKETVYQGKLQTLSTRKSIEELGNLIIKALDSPNLVISNGKLAGEYARNKFSKNKIKNNWLNFLANQGSEPQLSSIKPSFLNATYDLMRQTRLTMPIKRLYGKILKRPF
jgi:glycosyltransferase involved in cell wall biosynthesis